MVIISCAWRQLRNSVCETPGFKDILTRRVTVQAATEPSRRRTSKRPTCHVTAAGCFSLSTGSFRFGKRTHQDASVCFTLISVCLFQWEATESRCMPRAKTDGAYVCKLEMGTRLKASICKGASLRTTGRRFVTYVEPGIFDGCLSVTLERTTLTCDAVQGQAVKTLIIDNVVCPEPEPATSTTTKAPVPTKVI